MKYSDLIFGSIESDLRMMKECEIKEKLVECEDFLSKKKCEDSLGMSGFSGMTRTKMIVIAGILLDELETRSNLKIES